MIDTQLIQIQLIQAPRSEGYADNSRSACYAPVGLISIATYCQQQFPGADIEVLDGEIMSVAEIIRKLKPGAFVGIDTKLLNYESALMIVREAKKRACVVVLGGVFASALPEVVLQNQQGIVDFVVVGYGEKPMVSIIQWELGIIKKETPQIIRNENPDFDELPIPDRAAFVDMERYITNFQRLHETWPHYRVANVFTTQGCGYHCIFCDRTQPQDGRLWFNRPVRIWDELSMLYQKFGINYVVSFDDQITHNLDWLQKVIAYKPAGFPSVVWHVFSNAEHITPESIVLLRQLPAGHVFVGIETGDLELAQRAGKGKGFSPEVSLRAVQLLTKNRIQITPSFVLGLPGETEDTLERTLEFANTIKDISAFEEVFVACLIPFPGSRAFQILLQRCPHLRGQDNLDGEELSKLWFANFCQVSYETARRYAAKILELGQYRITLDKGGHL